LLLQVAVATALAVSTPSAPIDVSESKSYAKQYMSETYTWDESQFSCLEELWNRESGWNHKARNPSSGAYGIPQSLPGNKMHSAGADWKTNPQTQVRWGLKYIEGRYGSPCNAYQHFQKKHWY
jgi:resuscitation-promoting factor RpfB